MRLELATRRFYLGRDYSEALEGSGAVPLHLALIPKPEYISAAMDGLDGVLLPGSDSDVDPRYFGEDPHPCLGTVVPEKDETDLLVLAEAERRNMPVLAICFGMQSLNVSRGGTLVQDIRSQVPNYLNHQQGKPLDRHSHAITIEEGSILDGFSTAEQADRKLHVNSHHHQAVKAVGADLRAVAWTNDGVIEGIQDTRAGRFVLGVQWHPELNWHADPLSTDMFKWFVNVCKSEFERKCVVERDDNANFASELVECG